MTLRSGFGSRRRKTSPSFVSRLAFGMPEFFPVRVLAPAALRNLVQPTANSVYGAASAASCMAPPGSPLVRLHVLRGIVHGHSPRSARIPECNLSQKRGTNEKLSVFAWCFPRRILPKMMHPMTPTWKCEMNAVPVRTLGVASPIVVFTVPVKSPSVCVTLRRLPAPAADSRHGTSWSWCMGDYTCNDLKMTYHLRYESSSSPASLLQPNPPPVTPPTPCSRSPRRPLHRSLRRPLHQLLRQLLRRSRRRPLRRSLRPLCQ